MKTCLTTCSRSPTSPLCNSVNLTLCPASSRDTSPTSSPVEVLPDGSGLRYQRRHEEGDGAETCLEVKVGLEGSTTITTRRTGRTENTSNEISVQLVGGGNQVNIQQTSQKESVPAPAIRPTSLHLPSSRVSRQAQSLYQTRGTSPQSLPRYNSLPSFKNVQPGCSNGWEYQSHPRDDEKRLAYTRGELSDPVTSVEC